MGDSRNHLSGKGVQSRLDAVGFIDESKVVVILVLSAENNKEFENAYPAFVELIRSYNFLATINSIYK